MAKSKIVKINEKIAESVTAGFEKISDTVVSGYKKVQLNELLKKYREEKRDEIE